MVEAAVLQDNTPAPCSNALRGLQFLRFVLSGQPEACNCNDISIADADDTTTVDVAPSIGVSWFPPAIREPLLTQLNYVTCDGETMLITLPVNAVMPSAVTSTVTAITAIGFTFCGLTLAFVYTFHRRTAVRTAAPYFLVGELLQPCSAERCFAATVGGLCLMYLAGYFLAQPLPTDAQCSAAVWTGVLGLSFTFAPLFGKAWRIYKIFMVRRAANLI